MSASLSPVATSRHTTRRRGYVKHADCQFLNHRGASPCQAFGDTALIPRSRANRRGVMARSLSTRLNQPEVVRTATCCLWSKLVTAIFSCSSRCERGLPLSIQRLRLDPLFCSLCKCQRRFGKTLCCSSNFDCRAMRNRRTGQSSLLKCLYWLSIIFTCEKFLIWQLPERTKHTNGQRLKLHGYLSFNKPKPTTANPHNGSSKQPLPK